MAKTNHRQLDGAGHHPRGRKSCVALVVAALSTLLTGCGTHDSIRIGALYPTGGGQGPGGAQEWHGVQLALERSGLRGKVTLDLEETEKADEAPAAVDRLAAKGIKVILGGYGSTISNAATNAASRNGMLWWETGAVGPFGMAASPGTNVFRVPATGEVLGRNAVSFLHEVDLPSKGRNPAEMRYAIVYVDDVYGSSVANGARAQLSESGITPVADIGYNLRTVDWPDTIRELKQVGTDVLIVSAYLEDAIAMREETISSGLELVTSIGTSSSYCMLEFGERMKEDAVGLYASDKPDGHVVKEDALEAGARADLEWFRTEFKRLYEVEPPAPALAGYSGALAFFREILGKGVDPTPEAIAAAARTLDIAPADLPNASGLKFGPNGDNIRAAAVIWKWTGPGVREVVWPPAFAGK